MCILLQNRFATVNDHFRIFKEKRDLKILLINPGQNFLHCDLLIRQCI